MTEVNNKPTRNRWDDNIKMDLQEVEWGGIAWIVLGPDTGQMAGCCGFGIEPPGSKIRGIS